MRAHIKPDGWAEVAVFNQSVEAIQSMLEHLLPEDRNELRLAMMTAIALGDRGDLEEAFFDLAGSNPENWDSP
jgi:hypothetical protein